MPEVRAASTNSCDHKASALPRTMRANTGTLKMPIAITALSALGPNAAVNKMASKSAGNANTRSLARITVSSIQPGRAAATRPSGTPAKRPIAIATKATPSELRAPASTIDNTSRPS